jgi:hypothetical protein
MFDVGTKDIVRNALVASVQRSSCFDHCPCPTSRLSGFQLAPEQHSWDEREHGATAESLAAKVASMK